jgi:hypothetical protein
MTTLDSSATELHTISGGDCLLVIKDFGFGEIRILCGLDL